MESEEPSLSSSIPSSQDSATEDFKWVKDKNFLSEIKKDYLKYPLSEWRELVFDLKINEPFHL